MNSDDLRGRTKAFALAVIRLTETLPKTRTAEVLGRQLLRAGNIRWRQLSRRCTGAESRRDVAQLAIVEDEADECVIGWSSCWMRG